MLTIKLPDGNNLSFKSKVTGIQIAEKISKSLSKQALIMSVDGELKDLNFYFKRQRSFKYYSTRHSSYFGYGSAGTFSWNSSYNWSCYR